jgi:predicted TPR repeat methyltransferase
VQAGDPLDPVLDLGCGTGLVGVAVSDLPIGRLVGVDVSPRMLALAATRQLYAELREADLMQVLAEDPTCWQLILAADVLCYFGDLRQVFVQANNRLQPGGWFVFSVEELLPDKDNTIRGNGQWSLHRQGRYAHTLEYLGRTALETGFTIRILERQTVRQEANAPVAGLFGVLESARHDN